MMSDLLIAAVLAVLAARWADGMKARERANEFARGICTRANLSLLDDTVVLTASRWVRTPSAGWQLRRTYTFDYSVDPQARASGFVILLGYRLASSGLAADARE
jgi:hypothetical protein